MGTNFYLTTQPPCECCKREYPELHIGKSSGGWAFALRVYPDMNINSLEDWKAFWSKGGEIRDEYERVVTPERMKEWITNRRPDCRHSPIDGWHCIGHAPDNGTWDLIAGDFS